MKKLGVVFLTFIVLSSCYIPPFREELSLALPVTKKMEGAVVVGPLDRRPWDFQGREIVFYPSKDALRIQTNEFIRGFIVATDDRSARLMFVDHGLTVDDDYYIGSDNTFPLENPDDKAFVFRAVTLKDDNDNDSTEFLGIIAFNNVIKMREYLIFDQSLSVITGIDLNVGVLMLGAGFFPDSAPTADRFYSISIDAAGLYIEEEYDADSGLPSGWNRSPSALPGLPEDMTNCFYSLLPAPISPTNRAYLSVYDGARRQYRNFSWDDGLQLQILADMDRRIDLVLSNDWLFSKDGNKGYVYNGDGELLNSFVMGGLTLVYEMYDGVRNRVVFTIPVWAPVSTGDRNWEDKLYFLIYWIPIEQLADL
ncbi:MAG: hypothetical protein JSV89_04900 [Spirochaetaceae bacterium]|nr:MAG: hypothetical protein JSV89_04900 [Spirochaetaceae bacterium]